MCDRLGFPGTNLSAGKQFAAAWGIRFILEASGDTTRSQSGLNPNLRSGQFPKNEVRFCRVSLKEWGWQEAR
jgi:hypothetical protein